MIKSGLYRTKYSTPIWSFGNEPEMFPRPQLKRGEIFFIFEILKQTKNTKTIKILWLKNLKIAEIDVHKQDEITEVLI
jgi:hypothetical protein